MGRYPDDPELRDRPEMPKRLPLRTGPVGASASMCFECLEEPEGHFVRDCTNMISVDRLVVVQAVADLASLDCQRTSDGMSAMSQG